MSAPMDDDELKRRILEAFGVTQEEVDELDWLMFGPENRARRKREQEHFEDLIAHPPTELNALLPEGFEWKWGPQ